MYNFTFGNTTVSVEDLGRTYPGVCEHCGKLHIRYLATVSQDIVNTLDRHYKGEIPMEDLESATLAVNMLDGKTKKVCKVGCVCVGKYLVDCGVDVGLAQRLQEKASFITQKLQQLAALEVLCEKIPDSLKTWEDVVVARESYERYLMATVRPAAPASYTDTPSPEWTAYWRQVEVLRKEEQTLSKKWLTRHKGFWTNFSRSKPVTADALKDHYDWKARKIQAKLTAFQRGGTLV